ncbi:class I mannose-6-phosphate isomerase [Lapidilactobacillus achengensis]|uniref:Class I mannose-6-phosphate isomerase n=1 Tax=Lapidilactobacillus achengensis TaxID=2486000 RepID=A0ABW1UQN8_9LACO|nr:class I mannose-6-phosphate isomerase [Lapidilactobacillus achengensis]
MYDATPIFKVKKELPVYGNLAQIVAELSKSSAAMIAFDCYPGVDQRQLGQLLTQLPADRVLATDEVFLEPAALTAKLHSTLTDDELFGQFHDYDLAELIEPQKLRQLQADVAASPGRTVVYGVGAASLIAADLVVYVSLTRWQLQGRYREGQANWHSDNAQESWNRKIKRGYFFDWPLGDALKAKAFRQFDYLLDLNDPQQFRMVAAPDYLEIMGELAQRPFRLKPYFAPSVWGGHWLQENFGVEPDAPNLGWGFDGVPEENSLLLQVGTTVLEVPAQDLVMLKPQALLGEKTYGRYGESFPIRFDYLDTVGGGNLSLQVHPTAAYAYQQFKLPYTQDESYYIMAAAPQAQVILGVRTGVDPAELESALTTAQTTQKFAAEKFVNFLPVKAHDHFLIPAGTIHCSGAETVVLEISATPNRFTFKLWDWHRLDLDGRPRPINIQRGMANLDFGRDTNEVTQHLVNQIKPLRQTPGHQQEETGLAPSEAIRTIRDRFDRPITLTTHGDVIMACLVAGEEICLAPATATSASEAWLQLHYGETVIIPASVGDFRVFPSGPSQGQEVTLLSAQIR